jgi:HSP20 family protein
MVGHARRDLPSKQIHGRVCRGRPDGRRIALTSIELKEKDNAFEVKVAMAGVDPRDLQVEVTGDELLVNAVTKTEKKEEKENVQYSEFASGSLFRSIRFPNKVNADSVKAGKSRTAC